MPRHTALFGLAIATALLALIFVPARHAREALAQQLTNCDVPNASAPLTTDEQAAVTALNQYRGQRGLATVTMSLSLTRGARWKANAMAGGAAFDHNDPNRSFSQRVRDCGYTQSGVVENLSAGLDNGPGVIDQWKMSTAGHNENMLTPNARVAGIARATGGDFGFYWVLVLGPEQPNDVLPGGTAPPANPPANPPPANPPAGPQGPTDTIRLFPGCNLVGLTFPAGTTARQIAGAITPPGALQVMWQHNNETKRFSGFRPDAPDFANDFAMVARYEAIYICMNGAGQLARPA